jgi:hypothetical protein
VKISFKKKFLGEIVGKKIGLMFRINPKNWGFYHGTSVGAGSPEVKCASKYRFVDQ